MYEHAYANVYYHAIQMEQTYMQFCIQLYFFTYHVIQEKPNGKGILKTIGKFPSQRSVQHQNQPTKCRARHCTPILGVIVRIIFSAGTVTMLPRLYAFHNSPTYST
jgi:hypothetical protein